MSVRSRTPSVLLAVLLAVVLAVAGGRVALTSAMGHDYPGPTCIGCDFAGPSISALSRGDLHGLAANQPFIGTTSMILRAPVVAVTRAAGGDALWQYRLGALACILAVVLLAVWIAVLMRRRGSPFAACLLVGLLLVAGPMTAKSLEWGHPEELLAGALCVAAVILAGRGQALLGGLALGAAIATKQWAVMAILPAFMCAPGGRVRLLATAAGAALLLDAPMFLGDPIRFWHQNRIAGSTCCGVTPTNAWWVYGHESGMSLGGAGRDASEYAIPALIGRIAHPLVMVLAVAIPLAYMRLVPDVAARRPLHLLALLMLLRCLLDPYSISYHHTPFLLAAVAADALSRRGWPVFSTFAAAGLWFLGAVVAPHGDPDLLNRVYVGLALSALAYLVVVLSGRTRPQAALAPVPA